MKKVGHVKSYMFDEYFLISFSKRWLDLIDRKPEFDVFLDKGRIHLVSDKIGVEGKT